MQAESVLIAPSIQDGLYNRAYGIPPEADSLIGEYRLTYSRHAETAARQDRAGVLDLPDRITITRANLVEVEVVGGVIVKAVVRVPYVAPWDLTLVLALLEPGEKAWVKTVWTNHKSDNKPPKHRQRYVL